MQKTTVHTILDNFRDLIANISTTDPDWGIENQKKQMINYDPSHVGQKRFSEICFSSKKVALSHSDPPKINSEHDFGQL